MQQFCPKCGSEEGPLIKGFCKNCYLSEYRLIDIDRKLSIEKCKRCGKVRVSGKWMEQTERALKEYIKLKAKVKDLENAEINVTLKPEEENKIPAVIAVKGEINGTPLSFSEEILLKLSGVLCESCNRLASNYFEAILQLRFKEKPKKGQIDKMLSQVQEMLAVQKKGNSLAEIVKLVKLKNGFDAYIGSKRAAKEIAVAIARKHKIRIKTSFRQMGIDRKGKPRKRLTFSVKI